MLNYDCNWVRIGISLGILVFLIVFLLYGKDVLLKEKERGIFKEMQKDCTCLNEIRCDIIKIERRNKTIRKWKAIYSSMTASYNCGVYYAETKEEAEREARCRNRGTFTEGELTLIKCIEIKN